MGPIDILSDILSVDKRVTFEEFVKSDRYCGNPYIYDFWVKEAKAIEEKPDTQNEVIITGSLGGGKSLFGAYYLCYRVYQMFNDGDPRKKFSLDPNTWIYCLYFSVSMGMAKRQGFQYLQQAFRSCKWFKEYHPVNEDLSSCIQIPDLKFQIDYGSAEGHQIGLNVWGFILDEANFRSGVGQGVAEEYEEVTLIAQQLADRQASRFSTKDGTDALAIYISSASYQSSFIQKKIDESKGNTKSTVITVRTYEIKPEQYSEEKFTVFIGAGSLDPKIIDNEEEKKFIIKSLNLTEELASNLFLQVPCSLRRQFETNIVIALQNHCGVPTNIQGRFISNIKPLIDSYTEIPPILISDELEASTADDSNLIENILIDNIQFPERPHSLFLDLSYQSDMGGLCCYRYDGLIEGVPHHTRVFLLGIKPPTPPHQTKISKVEQFIYDLSQLIYIVAFGSDQFQSVQIRQNIQANLNLEDIRISIDSSDVPHLHWLNALIDGRIRTAPNKRLEREVEEAVHDYKRHRIVKRKGSSDDLFQSEVGAFFLSDTIGRSDVDLRDLYGPHMNLVGDRKQKDILRKLGYINI